MLHLPREEPDSRLHPVWPPVRVIAVNLNSNQGLHMHRATTHVLVLPACLSSCVPRGRCVCSECAGIVMDANRECPICREVAINAIRIYYTAQR